MKRAAALSCALVAAGGVAATAEGTHKPIPRPYQNCSQLDTVYPHGVGRVGAHDQTKSKTSEPVTDFKRSNAIYARAIRYNPSLDRDHDGVACEKH